MSIRQLSFSPDCYPDYFLRSSDGEYISCHRPILSKFVPVEKFPEGYEVPFPAAIIREGLLFMYHEIFRASKKTYVRRADILLFLLHLDFPLDYYYHIKMSEEELRKLIPYFVQTTKKDALVKIIKQIQFTEEDYTRDNFALIKALTPTGTLKYVAYGAVTKESETALLAYYKAYPDAPKFELYGHLWTTELYKYCSKRYKVYHGN